MRVLRGMNEPVGKRLFDLVVAVPSLIVFGPLIVGIGVAMRIVGGPGVFFRQERAGQYAEPFLIYKFRTMTQDRDEHGELLPDDVRLTRMGKVLRATSLDELPQLVNVLRGEMSIVGPRPLPMTYVDLYSERQRRRLEVKPGITGLAQVEGRNNLDWDERFECDVRYVEQESLLLDARIILRTFKPMFSGSGITPDGLASMPAFTGSNTSDRPTAG